MNGTAVTTTSNTASATALGTAPEGHATRPCDPNVVKQQIGFMNVLAISGGRIFANIAYDPEGSFIDGAIFPVSHGYRVVVRLAANDTYIVQRVFRRSGVDRVKAEWTDVHAEELSEIAYEASCFRN